MCDLTSTPPPEAPNGAFWGAGAAGALTGEKMGGGAAMGAAGTWIGAGAGAGIGAGCNGERKY